MRLWILFSEDDVSQSAIIVKDLTKVFPGSGFLAVNNISFHFPKGIFL